jgi:hypothetical protein
MSAFRDETKRMSDGEIWRICNLTAKIRPANPPKVASDRGACACGRLTVARFEASQCGRVETHSRKRCLFRKTKTIQTSNAW